VRFPGKTLSEIRDRLNRACLFLCPRDSRILTGSRPEKSNLNQTDQTQKQIVIDSYVSASECLAAIFPTGGICLRTFRTLQAQGYVPHLKLGKRTLFNPAEVRLALEKRLKRKAVAV
jgi:hypothetical protein